jgi:hypothetical protein
MGPRWGLTARYQKDNMASQNTDIGNKMKTLFQADDGTIHETLEQALARNTVRILTVDTDYARVCNCYQVKNLTKKHSRNDVGLWEIRGEAPPQRSDGEAHSPLIGRSECTLDKAIQIASESKHFFTTGIGGSIEKIEGAEA